MADATGKNIIFIREGTILPGNLSIETDAFLSGWRVVKSPDRAALTRGIEHANWNFFYRAGATRVTILVTDSQGSLRKAVTRVLAKQEERKFNALELTRVVTKRFFGIPFLSVVAHSRHIQESSALIPLRELVLSVSGAAELRSAHIADVKEQHQAA